MYACMSVCMYTCMYYVYLIESIGILTQSNVCSIVDGPETEKSLCRLHLSDLGLCVGLARVDEMHVRLYRYLVNS